MEVKNRFSPSEKVVSPTGHTPAQQQFKDDADINSIMKRFQKTGAIDHVAKHQPQYGVSTPQSLHEAMNIVTKAESMFADLPSSLRRRFNGSAAEMLEFVQNPENEEEAKKLGLALSDKAAAKAAEIREAAAASESAAAGSPASDSASVDPPPAEPPAE